MSRLRRALQWVIAKSRIPTKVIANDEGDPYLLRVYLTPDADWWRRWLPGVYLHHFYRSDEDRELHNHPWEWALAFILRGGYVEEYQQQDSWLGQEWDTTTGQAILSCGRIVIRLAPG